MIQLIRALGSALPQVLREEKALTSLSHPAVGRARSGQLAEMLETSLHHMLL